MYLFAYTILEEIPGFIDKDALSGDLSNYITGLIELSIIFAAIAAVLVIMFSGVSYMLSEAVPVKEDLKSRIGSALFGLILALSAWLILATINPKIVETNVDFSKLELNKLTERDRLKNLREQWNQLPPDERDQVPEKLLKVLAKNGTDNLEIDNVNSSETLNEYAPPPGKNAEKILKTAEYAAENKMASCTIDGVSQRVACVTTGLAVIEKALGKEISNTPSTSVIKDTLSKSPDFAFVGTDLSKSLPGDVIVAPRTSSTSGHLGIVGTTGAGDIYSNSSKHGYFYNNFKKESWEKYYHKQKGLTTYIYRAVD